MQRKIIQQSATSMGISLPSKWCKKWGVKKGDDMYIEESADKIIIIPATNSTIEETAEITLGTGSIGYVKSVINNLYRRGYDSVKLIHPPIARHKIIEALRETTGFELVEQKDTYVVIRNVAGIFEQEFDHLARRLFLVTLEIAEEGYRDICNKTFSLEQYTQLKLTVEKLMNMCCRTLNKGKLREQPTSKFIYLIVHTLDKIAYNYLYAYRLIAKQKTLSKPLLKFLKNVNEYLRALYTAYYQKDLAHVVFLTETKDTLLWDEGHALLMKLRGEEIIIVHHLMSAVRRIYECTSPFIGENI
ncbi:MAG: AbrB/MazE/SpoVT family DNA-binding domain-containing protein [Candidatus Woesearchaeota archaeon]